MRRPTTNRVTLPFNSSEPPYSALNRHNGTDYSYLPDRTVYAPADAVIITIADNGRDGNGIYFSSGGIQLGLLHLERFLVPTGAAVKAGQPVGIIGESGWAQGRHLHVAAKQNGRFIDPETLWTNQQEDEVIRDADNEYGRMRDLFWRVRGRELSRDEFRRHLVGITWLKAIEVLSDDVEAGTVQQAQEVGQLAIRDGWAEQIHRLSAVRAEQDQKLALLRQQVDKMAHIQKMDEIDDGLKAEALSKATAKVAALTKQLEAINRQQTVLNKELSQPEDTSSSPESPVVVENEPDSTIQPQPTAPWYIRLLATFVGGKAA